MIPIGYLINEIKRLNPVIEMLYCMKRTDYAMRAQNNYIFQNDRRAVTKKSNLIGKSF